MYGLTVREMAGGLAGEPFLDKLARADLEAFPAPPDPPDLLGYVELALRGGFPDAALLPSRMTRQAWLDGYLDQLLTRDVEALDGARDPRLLRLYFEALALNTAGAAREKTLYEAAKIDRKTAVAYERLLTNLLVLDTLPAWSSNRLSRLAKAGKRYLVDPSLATAALRLDEATVLRDGDLLGRIIDTFVVSQIRPEVELSPSRPRLHHLRARDGGHEVDLLIDMPMSNVLAIEIKATAAPKASDARHLSWLRDRLGDRFLAGAVLHTGPRPFLLGERIFALPICAIWGERRQLRHAPPRRLLVPSSCSSIVRAKCPIPGCSMTSRSACSRCSEFPPRWRSAHTRHWYSAAVVCPAGRRGLPRGPRWRTSCSSPRWRSRAASSHSRGE